jgi:hypothetical protein
MVASPHNACQHFSLSAKADFKLLRYEALIGRAPRTTLSATETFADWLKC